MNWKRVIALGLLGLTFGMGQSYAIDVNIPGADPYLLMNIRIIEKIPHNLDKWIKEL